MKDLISSVFAHEIKNALSSLKLGLEMLIKYDMNREEKVDFAQNSLHSISNTINIVEEYLEFVKFQFISNQVKTEEIDLYELLMDIRKDVTIYAEEKRVNLYLKKFHYTLQINKFWLKRAIYNIVFNAIKYNKEVGSVTISLEAHLTGVYISIRDTGIGINRDKLKNIFKLFERVENKSKGFGIGLALSKSVIENFGGNIKVESNKDIGTDFIIYLPKEPKSVTFKKVASVMLVSSFLLFLFVSNFPIYSQNYTKNLESGYYVYKFQDGSIGKISKNSDYKLKAYKNLYGTKFTIQSSLNSGEFSLKAIKNKAEIDVHNRKFNNLGTDFTIFRDNNTKVAVFEGAVKSDKLRVKKGSGVIISNSGIKQVKLLKGVNNIKTDNSILSFDFNIKVVRYQIFISENRNFDTILKNFYTTKNRIPIELDRDGVYYIKIYEYDENLMPSLPKIVSYLNLNHYNRAMKILTDKEEAILELKNSISTIGNHSSLPYFELSKLYYSKKEYKKSIDLIEKGIKIEEKLDYYLLLFKNYIKINKFDKITPILDKLIKQYPTNIDLLYYKSLELFNKKEYKNSQKYLWKVLELNPNYIEGNLLMSKILEKLGKKELSKYYKDLADNGNSK